jgi:hypothetical protein
MHCIQTVVSSVTGRDLVGASCFLYQIGFNEFICASHVVWDCLLVLRLLIGILAQSILDTGVNLNWLQYDLLIFRNLNFAI